MHRTSFPRHVATGAVRGRLSILAVSIGILAGCTVGPAPTPTVTVARRVFRPYEFSAAPTTTTTFTRLGWQHYTSPEYTDDQRWHDASGTYGPLAHIAPSDSLDSLKTVAAFDAYGDAGFVAGVIAVDTTAGSALPPTYSALNVVPGFNCIRLSHRASGWVAMVTPLSPTDPACPFNPAAPTLTAIPVHNAGYPAFTDVPAVARFHEGRSGANIRVPFFGLKCADAWCMVLPSGIDTLPMPQVGAGGGRGFVVHGWGDAQHLGVPDPTTQVVHASTLALASVTPDDRLGDYTIPADFSKDWVHVATVVMAGDPNSTTYGSKWHFRSGKNEIFIRTDATVATGWTGEVRNSKYFLGIPYRNYRYTVVVNRTDHSPMHIPGTARFWWYEHDEGLWVRCDEGCCQVAPS